MTAFWHTATGLVVSFDEVEASLLRHLVGEVRHLLAGAAPPGVAGTEPGRPPPPAGRSTDGRSAAGNGDRPRGRRGPRSGQPGPAGPGATGDLPSDAALAALTGLDRPAAQRPLDPALARLLPDGYQADQDAAGEFRRLTEATLRDSKCEAADRMLADLPAGGGEVQLDPETIEAWLAAINDVRLVLGTRLGVTEDMAPPDPEDPDAPAYVTYLWLHQLMEVLIEAIDE